MKNTKRAFTLAEALIALLIATLLVVATIPVVTKKHRDNAVHGKWMCTRNSSGNHAVRTVYDGIDSGFTALGSSGCKFSPPASAKNFTVKVIGGGGGGAGGSRGSEETIFDSSSGVENFATSIKKNGAYYVGIIGGGGGGGGNDCGEASDRLPASYLSFQDYSEYSEPNKKDSPYGSEDFAVGSFDYNKLWENDSADVFKYLYNPNSYKNRNLCFAENNWPFFKKVGDEISINTDKCWNYPGKGGSAGESVGTTVSLSAGQSIFARVGAAGRANGLGSTVRLTVDGSSVYAEAGGAGSNGAATIVDTGVSSPLVAGGGSGGYSRHIEWLSYNVPVYNCSKIKKEAYKDKNWYCRYANTISDCTSSQYCHAQTEVVDDGTEMVLIDGVLTEVPKTKTVLKSCYSDQEMYYAYPPEGACRYRDRTDYFSIPACVSSDSSRPKKNFANLADYPFLNPVIKKDAESNIDKGGAGSGGYGIGNFSSNFVTSAGEENEENPDIYYKLYGDDGQKGQAVILKISYTAGSGGQAGNYINTMFKKLPRMTVTVGMPGKGSSGDTRENGGNGEVTRFGGLFTVRGGAGGKANAVIDKVININGNNAMMGGDGSPSPLEAGGHVNKITPYGGYSQNNNSVNGQMPLTPVWNSTWWIRWRYGSGEPIGGSDLEMTYGAGGGGGAADSSRAGNGAPGAPGIVIIEW